MTDYYDEFTLCLCSTINIKETKWHPIYLLSHFYLYLPPSILDLYFSRAKI